MEERVGGVGAMGLWRVVLAFQFFIVFFLILVDVVGFGLN